MRALKYLYFVVFTLIVSSCSSGDGVEPFSKEDKKKQDILNTQQSKAFISHKWCTYSSGTHPSNNYQGFLRVDFQDNFYAVVEFYDEWGGQPLSSLNPDTAIVPWEFDGEKELTLTLKDSEELKMNIRFEDIENRHIMHTINKESGLKSHMWDCNNSVTDPIPKGFEPATNNEELLETDTDFEIDPEDLENIKEAQ